jgi:hypothetical protein
MEAYGSARCNRQQPTQLWLQLGGTWDRREEGDLREVLTTGGGRRSRPDSSVRWTAVCSSVLAPWRHPGAPVASGSSSPDAARHRRAPGGVDFIRRCSIASNRGSKLDGVAQLGWSACDDFSWGHAGRWGELRQGARCTGAPPKIGAGGSTAWRTRQGNCGGGDALPCPWRITASGLDGLQQARS